MQKKFTLISVIYVTFQIVDIEIIVPGQPRLASATCGARSVITVSCKKKCNKVALKSSFTSEIFTRHDILGDIKERGKRRVVD